MSTKTTCPRCGHPVTVTFSRRGTERIHTHKDASGEHCRSEWSKPRGAPVNPPGSTLGWDPVQGKYVKEPE